MLKENEAIGNLKTILQHLPNLQYTASKKNSTVVTSFYCLTSFSSSVLATFFFFCPLSVEISPPLKTSKEKKMREGGVSSGPLLIPEKGRDRDMARGKVLPTTTVREEKQKCKRRCL